MKSVMRDLDILEDDRVVLEVLLGAADYIRIVLLTKTVQLQLETELAHLAGGIDIICTSYRKPHLHIAIIRLSLPPSKRPN
jgi:hypothetical protein